MAEDDGPSRDLARRLRELRERHWPGGVTQKVVATGLNASTPLISSWENGKEIPPQERLIAYAQFFGTRRSIEGTPHIVPPNELTQAERREGDDLRRELLSLREAALRQDRAERDAAGRALTGPWHFGDGQPVTIICAEVPAAQRANLPTPEDPELVYGEHYIYADIDALIELHGHIRAANPTSHIRIRKASYVSADTLTTHLVLLGGADSNLATDRVLDRLEAPVKRAGLSPAEDWFAVADSDDKFAPALVDGRLVSDVGYFYRTRNPYNRKRTLTLCQGIFSLGTLGVVRALTDARFRERNADFLNERFADAIAYSLLMRVEVEFNQALTPDWTDDEVRLHEWPGMP